ncbi:MAG TPA: ABC transporter substrate-binding protein [Methylomirabilota bacterium]|nr:ABC transporter substrate-binding protein [Methylomirabilota bacterium]
MPTPRYVGALGIALAIFAASLTSLSAQPPQPLRREVRLGAPGLPGAIEPVTALEGAAAVIARQVFDTLMTFRESTTDVEPSLATRWVVSRDGLEWSFTIRERVRFHDGTPLTAATVVASFDRHLKAAARSTPTAWASLLRGAPGVVKEVRAVDVRTVQFTLAQPYAALLTLLAHPAFGVAREVSGADGVSRLVGTGPYRVTEASAGRIVIDAVPGHWAGQPRAERLVFLEVGDDDHAEAEFAAGALDVWFPVTAPRRSQWALSTPGPRVGYLAFQTEKEPFSRKKVRRAMAAAIDPAVLGVALGSGAVPLQSFLPAGVWARREGSPVLGGTRKQVAALLAEGQWPKGFTPTLVAPTESGSVDLKAVAEALQRTLQESDVPVTLRVEAEPAAAEARRAGDHDMAIAEASVAGGDPHLFLYPLSTSEGASKGAQTLNFSFYRNPRLDDMLIRASQLAYRPERQRLYQRAQAILAEEMPWVPLYVKLLWAVARPEVRGLRLHPSGFHRLTSLGLEG